MGFLDRLRSSAPTLKMTLDSAEVAPGGELAVRLEVGGEIDEKCRAIRVDLKALGQYYTMELEKDDDGSKDWVESPQSLDLFEEEQELPVELGTHVVTFRLPEDASPTSKDITKWTVHARIDRKGLDPERRLPVVVRRAAETPETAPAASGNGLTLTDVPAQVRGGEALTGQLTVAVTEDVSVSGVRIRLHRRCTYNAKRVNSTGVLGDLRPSEGGKSRIVKEAQVAEADLLGKFDSRAGEPRSTAFSIQVPPELASTTHPHARVEWRVEAVLDRRLKDDPAVSVPIVVV